MKKKVYFRYNPNTLSYERVYPKAKDRIFSVIRHLASGIIIGFGIFWILSKVYTSPLKIEQEKQLQLMNTQYELLSKRMDDAVEVIGDIQQRDDNMYRAIFHADPVPSSIRVSGVGAAGRYEELMNTPSANLIISTSKKMDYISKQLYVQSNSFDDILELAKNQQERIKHIPSIQPISNKDLNKLSSGYGMRIHPIYGTLKFHSGIDFTAKTGAPAYVTGKGKVILVDWKSGYGRCVIVDHGYDYKTLYAHLSKYNVRVGQTVERGQKIGEVGSTGTSTSPHLHYEVLYKDRHDNPAKYFFMDLTAEEYDQILRLAANHGQTMD